MRRQDFSYDLPQDLIANTPTANRTDSRLLCLSGASKAVRHRSFKALVDLVEPGDLMVFNDTRVIPARLYGCKQSGGKVEILVERITANQRVLAHVRASKSPKSGAVLLLDEGFEIEVVGRRGTLFELVFRGQLSVLNVLEKIGHMPLPPYIERSDDMADRTRYQTVYGNKLGAVAAPTAGLHFDTAMLDALRNKGVNLAFVTLHVGAGTFQPVRVDDIAEHQMHSEWMSVPASLCTAVNACKASGKRVIAVGTTSVRCLESAATDDGLKPFEGETDIFIYPGYRYRVVDALVTNFHLPESTLLMLVAAFAGYEITMQAYREAVAQRYRFFSYGDAMFVEPCERGDLDGNLP